MSRCLDVDVSCKQINNFVSSTFLLKAFNALKGHWSICTDWEQKERWRIQSFRFAVYNDSITKCTQQTIIVGNKSTCCLGSFILTLDSWIHVT